MNCIYERNGRREEKKERGGRKEEGGDLNCKVGWPAGSNNMSQSQSLRLGGVRWRKLAISKGTSGREQERPNSGRSCLDLLVGPEYVLRLSTIS
jgi:hypothetical protein